MNSLLTLSVIAGLCSGALADTESKDKPAPQREGATETANKDAKPKNPSHYREGRKTFDGTGKYYMGREIAYVMGHQAIRWLERSNRENEEAPSKAIAALNLKPTDVIADIGAGSGYYTFPPRPARPQGKSHGGRHSARDDCLLWRARRRSSGSPMSKRILAKWMTRS